MSDSPLHVCWLIFLPHTMKSLALSILLLLVPQPAQSEEAVQYCDKVFQLTDRSDESWARCRWSESLSPGSLTECEGGLECGGDCVPWADWCPPRPGSTREWRCGGLLSSPELCSHSDFWAARPCGGEHQGQPGARCKGWWPGQCSFSGTVTQSVRKYLEIF